MCKKSQPLCLFSPYQDKCKRTVSKDVNKLAKMKLPSLLKIRSVIISCGAAVLLAGEQVKRVFSPKERIIV